MSDIADIFIIGGGINGVGIAADAAGRGLSVVLAEQGDLGGGTSSASTKLIHGGLRYLEHYEFLLVRKALHEREVLLNVAPHIIRPLRFLLPYHKGLRPAWLIRLGLFIYDHLGGRKLLPATSKVDLRTGEYPGILKSEFELAFEYSDCWVDDARLVVLNACVARDKGAIILPRHKCVKASRSADCWHVGIRDMNNGDYKTVKAKILINASGPWIDEVIEETLDVTTRKLIRLVKGSHIIVRKLYDHDRAYIFQGGDGRVIFAIPYEDDFTLIGTTDKDFQGDLLNVTISQDEINYLCEMASEYFKAEINPEQVIHHYAGVRPLYDDGASAAQEATRNFVLRLNEQKTLLNIIGGKITTYRVLAEKALAKLKKLFPGMAAEWTSENPLPGGNFRFSEFEYYQNKLGRDYPFLEKSVLHRLFRSYGTKAWEMLGDVDNLEGMGQDFGAGLYEKEVLYLMDEEWAMTAEDILWRRTKMGLHMNQDQQGAFIHWLANRRPD